MNRINKILNNSNYKFYLNKISVLEKDRIFCRHTMDHFIAVSRVAYIMCLERNLSIKKDIIYAAGLLHDIGRFLEYEFNIDHAKASAFLSKNILIEAAFDSIEIKLILNAISRHRNKNLLDTGLDWIIYEADKQSRPCNNCLSLSKCKKFTNKIPTLTY